MKLLDLGDLGGEDLPFLTVRGLAIGRSAIRLPRAEITGISNVRVSQ